MFVYAIQNSGTGHIKFGIATDPLKRMSDLQVANSVRLVLLATFNDCREGYIPERLDARLIECRIHAHLGGGRLSGEWFLPAQATLNVVRHIEYGTIVDFLEKVRDEQEQSWEISDADQESASQQVRRLQDDLDATRARYHEMATSYRVLEDFRWRMKRALTKLESQLAGEVESVSPRALK